jgi:uncharacterized membrane protein YphA (DoxX/SURF4 family)
MKRTSTVLQLLLWFLRIGLAVVFVYAGATKLFDLSAFEQSIRDYGILLPGTEMAAAWTLAVLEILAALGVLFGIRGGLVLMAGLLVMFVGVLSYGLWLGLDIDCGCFGFGDSHGLGTALLIDLCLLVGCALLFTCNKWVIGLKRTPRANREVEELLNVDEATN